MKPTPGPKIDETLAGDFDVITNGVRVARFFQHGPISPEQARANAEAWIAGVAAIEKIPRLREAYQAVRGTGTTSRQWAEFYDALHALIDEP